MLFAAEVQNDGQSVLSRLSLGDVVRAGGDGKDWFDPAGRLIGGKATGSAVTPRPADEPSCPARAAGVSRDLRSGVK